MGLQPCEECLEVYTSVNISDIYDLMLPQLMVSDHRLFLASWRRKHRADAPEDSRNSTVPHFETWSQQG